MKTHRSDESLIYFSQFINNQVKKEKWKPIYLMRQTNNYIFIGKIKTCPKNERID